MSLTVLYRGPLASCNYACPYCPFAKRRESAADRRADSQALGRFLDWATRRGERSLSVLFTPWGEALVHRRYQDALARLTSLAQVDKAAIQTNLSCSLGWVERCDRRKLGLWCTYHPGQSTRESFLARCRELDRLAVSYSVGVVGLKEHAGEIEALRRELRPEVYLWINAYKRVPDYYTAADVARFNAIDPLFPINNTRHPSRGLACRTGHTVVAVDGEGSVRRCHFVKEPLGNLYAPDWEGALRARSCPNATCGCHIGYVFLEALALDEVFEEGLLERRLPAVAMGQPFRSEVFPSPEPAEPEDHGSPEQTAS